MPLFSSRRLGRKLSFTREGSWFFLLTLAVGAAAVNTGINLLYLALSMMLSLIIVSGILSEITLRRLSLSRRLPEYVFAHTPFSYQLVLANQKRCFSSFSLHLIDQPLPSPPSPPLFHASLLRLAPGQSLSLHVQGCLTRRGQQEFQQVEIRTRFPFGFFEKSRLLTIPGSLVVLPALGELDLVPLLRGGETQQQWQKVVAQRGGEEEFHSLREYRSGDNPRRIHWRSSARQQRLMVREFEQEERPAVSILLDTRLSGQPTPQEQAALETAISFAATLTLRLLERGFQVTLAAYTPHLTVQTVSGGPQKALPVLKTLALLVPNRERGIGELYQEVRPVLPAGTRFLVFWGEEDSLPQCSPEGREERIILCNVTTPAFATLFSLPEQVS